MSRIAKCSACIRKCPSNSPKLIPGLQTVDRSEVVFITSKASNFRYVWLVRSSPKHYEHHYVTNRLKCETLRKNGISAPFFYGAGMRIERGIFSESFCNEVHECTRSPRQHPICRVHKVNGHGWSVVFNEQ